MTMTTASFIIGFVVGELVGFVSAYIIISKGRKSKNEEHDRQREIQI